MRKNLIVFGLIAIVFMVIHECLAFELLNSNDTSVTEIITDQGIVCDQEQKICMAEGKIQVNRGKGILTCNKLIVHFDKGEKGKQELKTLEAFGNVHIFSPQDGYDATSEYGHYDVHQQLVTLKGNPVIKNKGLEIYGTGDVTYDQAKNIAATSHRATMKEKDKLLQANQLIAYFKKDEESNANTFDHLLANGNVIVSTPTELARAENGSYYEATKNAELWNNVVISRFDGQIRGPRAKVDMETGQSQMLQPATDPVSQQRVQALLLPKEQDKVQTAAESVE
jgi:lipopolysaccharide export system protein LptA